MEFSGRVGSSSDMRKVQLQHMPQDPVDGQMLCHEISAVAFARDLRGGHNLLRALFLEPQAVHVDVTCLGYSLTVKYTIGSRGVELEGNPEVRTHVHAEGLDAEAFTGPSDNSVEFGLCRALRNDCLGFRLRLYTMLADADAAR